MAEGESPYVPRQRPEIKQHFEEVKIAQEIEALLERENPAEFDIRWLKKKNDSLYWRLIANNGGNYKDRDWQRTIMLLSEKWRALANPSVLPVKRGIIIGSKKRERNWQKTDRTEKTEIGGRTLTEEVQRLELLLDKENPLVFNVIWIVTSDSALARQLYRKARNKEGQPDWVRVVEMLPEKWQLRWKPGPGVRSGWKITDATKEKRKKITRVKTAKERAEEPTIEDIENKKKIYNIVKAFNALLNGLQPKVFSPSWVSANAPYLYEDITANITAGVILSWDMLVALLEPSWKQKYDKRFKVVLPKKAKVAEAAPAPASQYRDTVEVEQGLEPYANKLYTLVEVVDFNDREQRDKICQLLITLIRKGNRAAKEKLVELIYPLMQNWFDIYLDLEIFRYDNELVDNLIERCVINFNNGGNFLRYLLVTFRGKAKQYRRMLAGSLDKQISGGDDRKLGEIIPDMELGKVDEDEGEEE